MTTTSAAMCTATWVASLSSLPVAAVYVVANVALAVHIYHGAWSMFQTLGVTNPHIKRLSRGFAVGVATLVCVGNLSFPVMVQTGVIDQDEAADETTEVFRNGSVEHSTASTS